ncbi:hypothetical protein COV17_00915 [Candidatus Woesearchaeota archaeon CG10_big_fil_rev_8_21_14_0_10_36_11]|nr:MAG: hypothetical protein COV17_00915 [Candidatus Woesearchaeota archaeon CG10_big_fil_rev_8_21_14_0_10_36_11]
MGLTKAVSVGAGVREGLSQAAGALKASSFLLMILGISHYLLRIFNFNIVLIHISSLILFVIAGYALASKVEKDKAAILLPMLFFVIWYYAFQASIGIPFIFYFVGICIFLLVLLGGLTKGKTVQPELYGFIPVIFLFLDIGLIPFLVENLHLQITPLVESLALYMPWWAFLGLMTLPLGENKGTNALISIARIAGILYIVSILVIPTIPGVGYDDAQSLIPEADEFEAAQARLREKIPKGENPAWSNLACIFSGRYADVAECVKERQELSELKDFCETVGQIDPKDTENFNKCIENERTKKTQAAFQVVGAVDRELKPSKFMFVIDKDFAVTDTFLSLGTPQYRINFEYENPLKQELTAEFSCHFTQSGTTKVEGKVSPATAVLIAEKRSESVTCEPSGELSPGQYNVVYTAQLKNVKTSAYAVRFFIGATTYEEEVKVINLITEAEGANFKTQYKESQSPSDPVQLIFGYGNPPGEVVISGSKPIEVGVSVKNSGEGKLTAINSYAVTMDGFTGDCLQSTKRISFPLNKTTVRQFGLASCTLSTYPSELKDTFQYEKRTYWADLVYDYVIENNKMSVTVHE